MDHSTTPHITVPDVEVTSVGDEQTSPTSPPSPRPTIKTSGLLSPTTPQTRYSLDAAGSPTLTDDGSYVPPSPTLTNTSGQFPSTLALRDNRPDETSGALSVGLLSPTSHNRRPSIASSETTQADNCPELHRITSDATSTTDVASSSKHGKTDSGGSSDMKKKDKRKKNILPQEDNKPEDSDRVELDEHSDINPAPFHHRPNTLASIVDSKSLNILESSGGVDGLLIGLGTSRSKGLSKDALERTLSRNSNYIPDHGGGPQHERKTSVPAIMLTDPSGEAAPSEPDTVDHDAPYTGTFADRRRVYGENVLPQRLSKSLLLLMWIALKDKIMILLSVAAVVSFALGLFQDFGTPRTSDDPPVDWVEGVAIMVAIVIVVVVGSLNDWQKERQFKVLNDKKEERGVKVIRDGLERVVDVKEVVVGDIALVEPGEIVPVDGVFLSGHNVKCDESGATGETDLIKKISYEECLTLQEKAINEGKSFAAGHSDCFVVSGAKVVEGVGSYVVVAVGPRSFHGRTMMAVRKDSPSTPLQHKLDDLAELIAKLGSLAGLLLFVALMIRFFVQLGQGTPVRTASEKGIAFVNILIIAVTLIVVAVPEGLPLAVTLALAFATKRMTKENLLVRVLGACETMANASVVCTDKTGTLTQNEMTVVAGSLGIHAKFVRNLAENKARSNADQPTETEARKHVNDFSVDQSELNSVMSPQLQDLFNTAIAVNSTAFEDKDPETKQSIFVGSKTETALLNFAKDMGWQNFMETRNSAEIVQMIPFSSERKAMGVVVALNGGKYRAYFKGASEILAKKCTRHVVVHRDGAQTSSNDIETAPIDDLANDNISRTIIFYANQTLRTIAICYRDLESWPPVNVELNEEGEIPYDHLAQDLTLIGITGIEDPLRPGVRDAVANCQRAGVTIKMCTGDNVLTARSIATQCGIFTSGGIIMEGPVFRKLSELERQELVPRLQVLARSSPSDKDLLVEALKLNGEIVGVTGDGTNDGPALKSAHVGFSMGITGTEVAKEASDIILMDDNFASIVKAIMWGRCVNDAVRKFLQFQLSTNVTAVVITFVSAIASTEETSVLSAVQLLWINIIMDTFAALALATDPAHESLLNRKPDSISAPLFSVDMYKQILFQSAYQIAITLVFHFLGLRILGLDSSVSKNSSIVQTLVFNAFVFAQIFNSINSRRLDRHFNVLEGILENYYFIAITLIEIGVQVLIVFVGGSAFQVTRVGGREWGISLALGFVSLPLGAIIRMMPNEPFEKLFTKLGLLGRTSVLPTTNPAMANPGWNGTISLVRNNLSTFANLRGGRVRASSFVLKNRTAQLAPHDPPLRLSSLLTMAPTLMVGAVAAGDAFKHTHDLSDPTNSDPSKSSAALWEGRLQIHPETSQQDPVYQKFTLDQKS